MREGTEDSLAPHAGSCHMVQFFEDGTSLGETVAHYVGSGLLGGELVLVIASAPHRGAFRERLHAAAFDLERAEASGLYSELDARDTLARFMVDGLPDATRFDEVVGGRIALLRRVRPGVRVRAYGEMVNLLWQDGNHAAALALELLWNRLCTREALSLLCAYSATHFEGSRSSADFESVRAAHSHVIPPGAPAIPPDAAGQLRELTLLQQRAAELAGEVVRREALEEALRRALLAATDARTEAERTVRYNELFAGMLGHDLRNPLNAVATTAHYLTRMSQEPKVLTAANRIISSSNRMARMIEQLLDFTRMRVGNGLRVHRCRTDVRTLCETIKAELESAHAGSEITIVSEGDTSGELDADRMMQVLSNLIANAVHHGTVGGEVGVAVDGTDPASLAIEVHNAGIVAPEVIPVLFEPFRALGKSQHSQGLGLGLYLSQQLVLAHGGTITVASHEAEGTRIRVRMPRTAAGREEIPCLQR